MSNKLDQDHTQKKLNKVIFYNNNIMIIDDTRMISGLNCLQRYQRSLVNPEKEE